MAERSGQQVAAGGADASTAAGILTSIGITGGDCLSSDEQESMGNLTLNELKGLAKAQKLLQPAGPTGGV